MIQVNKNILKKIYPKKPENSRKYDYGLLVVIGGSEFYSGSPALSALAAFRAGVDMVRIIAPKRAADIIASFTPDLAAYPLKGNYLTKEDLPTLISMIKGAQAVSNGKTALVIGGGLGRSEEVKEAVIELLSQIDVPAVIDADGIYALEKNLNLIAERPFLLTPHLYEFFVLTGREVEGHSFKEKIKIVHEEAKRLKTTILLKGRKDIISNGKKVAISKSGSPYLTKGGTGDTLAGIAGAFLARGIDPFLAGQAAALINSKAGALAAKEFGVSLTATDLINSIRKVLKNQ